jgi:hypothetical protein
VFACLISIVIELSFFPLYLAEYVAVGCLASEW